MALIDDYRAKLQADLNLTLALVAGGEDAIDIGDGTESVLSPETMAVQAEAFAWLKARRDWLRATLAALDTGLGQGFDELKLFDVPETVKNEVALKQKQMADFSALLRPVVLGADALAVTERPQG